jgi:hypothetical protein
MSGSGNVTMRFQVNGVAVWARGSNAIPLDEFNGRADAAALMQVHYQPSCPFLFFSSFQLPASQCYSKCAAPQRQA